MASRNDQVRSVTSVSRIAVVGPESSGKSTLSASLATMFGGCVVEELARTTLTERGGKYERSDLVALCLSQMAREDEIAREHSVLFCDTCSLSFVVWDLVKYGDIDDQIAAAFLNSHYELYLLLQPDLPWEPDPLRESSSVNVRKRIFEVHRRLLSEHDKAYAVIGGAAEKRLDAAKSVIEKRTNLRPLK